MIVDILSIIDRRVFDLTDRGHQFRRSRCLPVRSQRHRPAGVPHPAGRSQIRQSMQIVRVLPRQIRVGGQRDQRQQPTQQEFILIAIDKSLMKSKRELHVLKSRLHKLTAS